MPFPASQFPCPVHRREPARSARSLNPALSTDCRGRVSRRFHRVLRPKGPGSFSKGGRSSPAEDKPAPVSTSKRGHRPYLLVEDQEADQQGVEDEGLDQ